MIQIVASLRAEHQANLEAVRMVLFIWKLGHLGKVFLVKKPLSWSGTLCFVLGKTLNSHSAPLYPGEKMGTGKWKKWTLACAFGARFFDDQLRNSIFITPHHKLRSAVPVLSEFPSIDCLTIRKMWNEKRKKTTKEYKLGKKGNRGRYFIHLLARVKSSFYLQKEISSYLYNKKPKE